MGLCTQRIRDARRKEAVDVVRRDRSAPSHRGRGNGGRPDEPGPEVFLGIPGTQYINCPAPGAAPSLPFSRPPSTSTADAMLPGSPDGPASPCGRRVAGPLPSLRLSPSTSTANVISPGSPDDPGSPCGSASSALDAVRRTGRSAVCMPLRSLSTAMVITPGWRSAWPAGVSDACRRRVAAWRWGRRRSRRRRLPPGARRNAPGQRRAPTRPAAETPGSFNGPRGVYVQASPRRHGDTENV
jgi:hypothetical protein